ncbi:MAG: class I SAM-dependent methyltransferase [Candidatus Acidiferrales bacterium]
MIPGTELLAHPRAYLFWQGKFAEQKLAPMYAHNDLSRVRRVLDVGCGPGTNTRHFASAQYLGVDVNPAYIQYARRLYHRDFLAADVCEYTAPPGEKYDFILANSFLHHVDLASTRRILSHLSTLLTEDGHVHVIEVVMPERQGLRRQLARWDRGRFVRPLAEWRDIFSESLEPVVLEPFWLTRFGVKFWDMVYFKGRARS